MPSFVYTQNIPTGPHNPSTDQPNMATNTNSTLGIINVDHYTFGSAGNFDGYHQQVTFPANGTAGTPMGLASTVYSAPGTADNSKSQLYYKNALSAYPISLIKAYATIDNAGVVTSGFGVMGPVTFLSGVYTVTLSTALPSTVYGVLAFAQQGATGSFLSYAIATSSQFVINHFNTSTQVGFTVIVLQF